MIIALSLILSVSVQAQVAIPTATPAPLPINAWSEIKFPTVGQAEPIGFYSKGCMAGASTLPLEGTGYQVMRVMRNRYYGHPDTLNFVTKLGTSLSALGTAVLIGDMAQPRGGPLPYGHASHQIGLDVDVWFWTHPEQMIRSLTVEERNLLPLLTVLNSNGMVDPNKFTQKEILKLKVAAADPKVERIFVNPAIKSYLCTTLPANELPWLHKIRSWAGHEDHFHVRLSCPVDAKNCVHQEPITPGDGCSEVNPPLKDSTHITVKPNEISPIMEKLILPDPLPAECTKILKE